MAKNVFTFNENQVCTNSEELLIYKSGHDSATVRLAQTDEGKWCYGYSWDCHTGGSSCGASKSDYRTLYPTRQKALVAAIDNGIDWSKKYETYPDGQGEKHVRFTKALLAYRASLFQLTLF